MDTLLLLCLEESHQSISNSLANGFPSIIFFSKIKKNPLRQFDILILYIF